MNMWFKAIVDDKLGTICVFFSVIFRCWQLYCWMKGNERVLNFHFYCIQQRRNDFQMIILNFFFFFLINWLICEVLHSLYLSRLKKGVEIHCDVEEKNITRMPNDKMKNNFTWMLHFLWSKAIPGKITEFRFHFVAATKYVIVAREARAFVQNTSHRWTRHWENIIHQTICASILQSKLSSHHRSWFCA